MKKIFFYWVTATMAVLITLLASIDCMAQDSVLQRFEQDGKWGFKDPQGMVIVKPVYDAVFDFADGMARVLKKDDYGFIDLSGREVIKPQYIAATDFENDMAMVSREKTDVNALLMRVASGLNAGSLEMAGGIDRYTGTANTLSGSRIMLWNATHDAQQKLSNGLHGENRSGKIIKIGLIDKSGKEIIPAKYTSIYKFMGNLWVASLWNGDIDNGGVPLIRHGMYDIGKGREVIPVEYTAFNAEPLADKKWIVVVTSKFKLSWVNYWEHKCGVIDYDNKVIIPLQYHRLDAAIFAPYERLLVANTLKGKKLRMEKMGVIDHSGRSIIPLTACEGIVLEGDIFVMTLSSGEKRRFDLDGKPLNKEK